MSTSNGDYSISINAQLDTSNVQKTYDQLKGNLERKELKIPLDVKIDNIMPQLNRNFTEFGQHLDESMKRVNTSLKNTTGEINGEIVSLIKTTETYKNKIGDVQERTSIWTKDGKLLASSLNTIREGVTEVNTATEVTVEKIGEFDAKVTTVTKTLQGTGDATRTVITTTKEWVDEEGKLNQQITTTDEKGKHLSATVTNVSNDSKKAAKAVKDLATEMSKINGINDNALVSKTTTSTKGMVTQFGDTSGKQFDALITTIRQVDREGKVTIKTIQEFTNAEGQLVQQTRTTDQNLKKIAEDEIIVGDNATKAGNGLNTLSNNARNAGEGFSRLNWSLTDAFRRLANFYLASLPIRAFQTTITNSIQTVKEFDAAITEMGKVSDYSGKKLRDYTKQLAEMGTEVARTQTEMTEATTGWLKAGYSEEDAAKLAKFSALLQNTADEELSSAEATSILVSQLKAYHMEADEAIKVTDIINKVSANQAVSSYDISQGLTMASAAMSTFGNSIEQTTALLTAGTTVFQGRSKQVARGLNMIATRITKSEKDLKKYGVSIYNTAGELRSTYDILVDLAPKWEAMSKAEQVALGNTLAGTNQYKILAAVMSQMDVAIESYDQALNASGETMKQNAVYMDSIEAKTTALKAEFERLVLGDGGLQNVSKLLLDVSTGFLKLANSDLGRIVVEISALTAAVMLLVTAIKSLTIAMATNPILLLVTALAAVTVIAIEAANAEDSLTRAHRENVEAVKESIQEYNKLTSEIASLESQIKDIENKKVNISDENDLRTLELEEDALKRQLKLLEAQAEIERKRAEQKAKEEAALKVAFVGTDGERQDLSRSDAVKAQIDMLEELYDKQEDLQNQIVEYTSEMSKMSDQGSADYLRLQSEVEHTTEESEKLKNQIDQTEEGFRDFLADTDAIANALTSADRETKNLKKSLVDLVEEGLGYFDEQSLTAIRQELAEISEGGNVDLTLRPRIDTKLLEEAGYDAGEGVATVFTHTFTNEANDIAMNFTPIMVDPETGEFLGVMKKDEFEQYCEDVVDGVREDDLNLKIGVDFKKEDTENFIQEAEQVAQRTHELHEAEDELTASVAEYNDEAEESDEIIEENTNAIDELAESHGIAAEQLKEWAKELDTTEESLIDNADSMHLTVEQYYDLARAAKSAKDTISAANSVIDGFQDGLQKAQAALNEYNQQGYLTVDTFQDLMGVSAQYLTSLVNENGQLEINEQTLQNLIATIKENKIEELQLAEVNDILSFAYGDVEKLSGLAQGAIAGAGAAAETAGQQAQNGSSGFWSLAEAMSAANAAATGDVIDTTHVEAKLQRIHNAYANLANQISRTYVNVSSAAKSAGKAGASGAKQANDAQKDLNKTLNDTKSKYDRVISWISKQYDKQIESIRKAKDEAVKAIEAEIKAIEKEKDRAIKSIEAQIKALQKQKEARKKYWDAQIEALKNENKERKDALELQEKLDALERAKNTRVKIYKEGQGFVYDVDQNEVEKAQKELDEYLYEQAYEEKLAKLEELRDKELENYEQRIDALNDYKDRVQESYEKQIEDLQEYKEQVEEEYDAQIEMYQNLKEEFEEMVNKYQEEQDRLLFEQLTGIKTENGNWMTRLSNLQKFVNEYNSLLAQLGTENTGVSSSASFSSGSYTGSSKSSGWNKSQALSNQGYHGMPTNVTGKHASGVSSIAEDEIAIVGENPNQEIVIGSKLNNGQLMSLNKGTGVVNAKSSTTLAGMLNQVGQFGASGFGSGNGTLNNNINNDSLVINGVTIQGANISDPQTFVNGLLNLKAEALQRAYSHR